MRHRTIRWYFLFRGSANSGTRQEPGATNGHARFVDQGATKAVELEGGMKKLRRFFQGEMSNDDFENLQCDVVALLVGAVMLATWFFVSGP